MSVERADTTVPTQRMDVDPNDRPEDTRPRCDAFVIQEAEDGAEAHVFVCELRTPHEPWLHVNGDISWKG